MWRPCCSALWAPTVASQRASSIATRAAQTEHTVLHCTALYCLPNSKEKLMQDISTRHRGGAHRAPTRVCIHVDPVPPRLAERTSDVVAGGIVLLSLRWTHAAAVLCERAAAARMAPYRPPSTLLRATLVPASACSISPPSCTPWSTSSSSEPWEPPGWENSSAERRGSAELLVATFKQVQYRAAMMHELRAAGGKC